MHEFAAADIQNSGVRLQLETGLGSSVRTVIGRHEFLLKLSPICTLHISLNFILSFIFNHSYTITIHTLQSITAWTLT